MVQMFLRRFVNLFRLLTMQTTTRESALWRLKIFTVLTVWFSPLQSILSKQFQFLLFKQRHTVSFPVVLPLATVVWQESCVKSVLMPVRNTVTLAYGWFLQPGIKSQPGQQLDLKIIVIQLLGNHMGGKNPWKNMLMSSELCTVKSSLVE